MLKEEQGPNRDPVLCELAAEAAARLDRPDELLGLLLADWRDRGESPARYVEYLIHLGEDHMAAVLARYVLSKPDCPERSRIEAVLESIAPHRTAGGRPSSHSPTPPHWTPGSS